MDKLKNEMERIEQGNAWEETDEVVKIKPSSSLDKVIPIRLSTEDWSKLREEASLRGVGPTTLARIWLLEHLKAVEHKQPDTAKPPAYVQSNCLDYVIPAIAFNDYCKNINIEKLDYSLFSQWVDLINKTRDHTTSAKT
ncbi:MAG: hypothetical protein JW954_05110 [Dehalococcoidaceae bacterium]|nr:hypothetical protein [Dehalococcoidaceae bacterium]